MSTSSATLDAPAASPAAATAAVTQVQPYLFFDGKCEEAIAFYKQAVGAREVVKMRFKDSPEKCEGMPEVDGDKVMHMAFLIGKTEVLASDGMCEGNSTFKGFSLAISTPDDATTKQYFDALVEGGSVCMPLAKTFWSSSYGMLTDKFGVAWMVMTTPHQP